MEAIRPQDRDTICALATPQGQGGLAVIRISGSRALEIVRQLAPFLPESPESHRVYFCKLRKLAPNKKPTPQEAGPRMAESKEWPGPKKKPAPQMVRA